MPVPTDIDDLSTNPALNDPPGSDNVFPGLDEHLRFGYSCIAQLRDQSTAFTRTLLDDTTAAEARTTLGAAASGIWFNVIEQGGAVADGVTNCSTQIEAAAAALAALGGGVLYFPPGTTGIYKCNNRLDLPYSNVLYYGPGVTLDFSGLSEQDGSTYKFIKVVGGTGFGTAYNLTANATDGAYSVTLDAGEAANFAAGDWCQITAENAYDYGAATVKKGEIKQIQSVSSGTVTFRQALYDSYTTANTAKIRKVTFIENVGFEGFTIKGKNTAANTDVGLEFEFVNRFHVRGCKFRDIDQQALRVYNSIRGDIDGNWFDGVRYTGSGLLFYGVVLWNGSQWINVRNNHGHELRHLVTTSCTATKYGEPFFYTVTGNIAENSMAGDAQASWAYENHGFGRFGIWANNIADSCHTGINLEKGDQIVTGNIFRNCRVNGVYCDADARELKNLIITNNYISKATTDSASGSFFGFAIPASASQVRENIRFSGNIIEGFGVASRSDFGIRIYTGSGAAKNCVISGNTIHNNGAFESTDFGTYVEQGGWRITGNTYRDYERCISVLAGADSVTIDGNEVIVTAAASTQNAVSIAANNCAVVNNTFRGCYRAIAIATGGTSNKVAGNNQFGTTITAVSDSGTGTVLNYGAVSGF